ncbi:hypothetical protein Q5P01_023032 [Channa striata]|uniref:Uncharacterized protein n=1 Tax=Channa striata TaxID=64152 RepID=A0AA88RWR2_CHASR|nr:hypothetical protein Q5P01_023032 [Channa striata]
MNPGLLILRPQRFTSQHLLILSCDDQQHAALVSPVFPPVLDAACRLHRDPFGLQFRRSQPAPATDHGNVKKKFAVAPELIRLIRICQHLLIRNYDDQQHAALVSTVFPPVLDAACGLHGDRVQHQLSTSLAVALTDALTHQYLLNTVMTSNMLLLSPLCFLLCWMLPVDSIGIRSGFSSEEANQPLPLTMVGDAVDDMYAGCKEPMRKMLALLRRLLV